MKTLKYIIKSIFIILLFAIVILGCKRNEPNDGDPVLKKYTRWIREGQSALPELKLALKNGNWKVRSHALMAIGKINDKSMTPYVFERLIKDKSIPVKNCSIAALGNLKSIESVPVLISLLDNKKTAAGRVVSKSVIIDALGNIGDSRAVDPLYLSLYDPNKEIRMKIVRALIEIGDSSVSKKLLKNKGDIVKHGIQLEAAIIFGELPVNGSESFLLEELTREDMQVKIAAIKSLGKLKSKGATPLLLREIANNNKLTIKSAARALIAIDDPKAVNTLCILLQSRNKSIAYSSSYILANMSSKRIGNRVYSIVLNNSKTNGPGAYVLGRKRYGPSVLLLRKRLAMKEHTGKNEMAEAIGWLGDRKSIPLLMKIAGTMPEEGSQGAIWSLGKLQAKESVSLLVELLEKRNEQCTGLIVSTLGAIGDEKAVMPIIYLLYEQGQKYAMVAAKSLAKIGGPAVVGFVKANIKSNDILKKRTALYTLSKLENADIIPFCIELLKENNDEKTFNKNNAYIIASLKLNTGKSFDTVSEWKEWYAKK